MIKYICNKCKKESKENVKKFHTVTFDNGHLCNVCFKKFNKKRNILATKEVIELNKEFNLL